MDDRPFDRLKLSACLIARDEERDIADALSSLDFVDEIVLVLDQNTTDRTAEVARETVGAGQRLEIVEQEWLGHVAQKNVALDHATHDWVLCLDADERVSPELRREIVEVFNTTGPRRSLGFSCPRRTFCLGRWIGHGGWYPDRKIRLFHRGHGRWGGVDPHDRVELRGPLGLLSGDLHHLSYRDLFDHMEKMRAYTEISATRLFEKRRRGAFLRMLFEPPMKFVHMYLLRGGFLDRFPGLILAGLASYYVFLKYAQLHEKYRDEKRARSHGAVRVSS